MTTNYDPITAEVISMAMQSIVGEMGITVERTSGSPGATDAKDYSCVLARADGGTIAYYGNNLQHLGDSRTGTEAIIREFPVAVIREGDVFIYNDPFSTGALHQADVAIQTPVFHESRLVAWVFTNIHMADIGGMSASGFTPESRDVYSEGLRMPPTRIVVGGVDNVSVWTTIKANVRTPVVMGDIRSAIAANNVGKMRFLQTCDEHGQAEVARYLAVNERLVGEVLRSRIQQIRPGTYRSRDWIEYDPFSPVEYVPIDCVLEVRDDGTLTFDFSESGRQVPGYSNGSRGAILGSVMSVMLAALLPDFAVNAGVYNCLNVRLGTAGRITNPTEPAGVSGGHMEAGPRCLRAAHRALTSAMVMSDSQWIRSRAYALGGVTVGVIVLTGHLNDGGRGYAFMLDQQATGHGALPMSDGVGFGGIDYSIAGREPDVESSESTGPILYLWRREVPDSGGAGAHRGGNSLETMFVPWGATYAEISHACAGGAIPTMGVAGGFPGGTTYTEIHRDILVQGFRRLPDPSDPGAPTNVIASKVGRIELAARDGVRQVIAAGAGWGDPLLRPGEIVAADVRAGRVTRRAAHDAYGVILDEQGMVLTDETQAHRLQLRRERGATAPEKVSFDVRHPLQLDGGRTACSHCRHDLSTAEDDWHGAAAQSESDLYDRVSSLRTPIISAQADFRLIEFTCPTCGTVLDMRIVGLRECSSHG